MDFFCLLKNTWRRALTLSDFFIPVRVISEILFYRPQETKSIARVFTLNAFNLLLSIISSHLFWLFCLFWLYFISCINIGEPRENKRFWKINLFLYVSPRLPPRFTASISTQGGRATRPSQVSCTSSTRTLRKNWDFQPVNGRYKVFSLCVFTRKEYRLEI